LAGVLVFFTLEKLIPHIHFLIKKEKIKSAHKRALLLAGTITLHNIPEGFAIASAFAGSNTLGWLVTSSIALQDIPEGMIVSAPLVCCGLSNKRSSFWGIFSGVAEFIAARFAMEAVKTKCHALKHIDEYSIHAKEISTGCIILSEVLELTEEEQKMMGVAGLIHDIGRLIILIASDSRNAPLVGSSLEKFQKILEDEMLIWGMDHSQAGARVCQRWHLPEELEEAVSRHHTPLIDDDFSFHGSIILLAHFIVVSDFTGEIINRLLPDRLFQKMNITPEQIATASRLYQERK